MLLTVPPPSSITTRLLSTSLIWSVLKRKRMTALPSISPSCSKYPTPLENNSARVMGRSTAANAAAKPAWPPTPTAGGGVVRPVSASACRGLNIPGYTKRVSPAMVKPKANVCVDLMSFSLRWG